MIEDLLGSGSTEAEGDVAVIGGGTLGLPMAVAFARRGLKVVCVESGGWTQENDTHTLNEVVYTRSVYAGAAHGRFRCLGGTSTRWGGALIPFLEADVEDAGWPVAHSEIVAYQSSVERLFDLSEGSYDALGLLKDKQGEPTHIPRFAKWPPFRKRNVFNLLSDEARSLSNLRIMINATVTDFDAPEGTLSRIVARASDGSRLALRAKKFIFAAGAVETTRLLLLLDQQNNGCLSRKGDQLGRNFHDHLSVPIGALECKDRRALNRLAGFRFERGGGMRNLRFELAPSTPLRREIKPCFAHIAFEQQGNGGFATLRLIYQHLQRRSVPPPQLVIGLARDLPWLLRAVWWRMFESRLLYPSDAAISVHMVIEQVPRPNNRIRLSNDRRDCFGRELAQIEWSVDAEDEHNLHLSVDAFEAFWHRSNLEDIARFVRRDRREMAADLSAGGSIYHPGGSTRMAQSPEQGVVDADLRLFGVPNVRIVSTSVLPTGGGGNPTMMAAMLAFRCVDNVIAELLR